MSSVEVQRPKRNAFGGRKVIDVDMHLTGPHDMWTKRASPQVRDAANDTHS